MKRVAILLGLLGAVPALANEPALPPAAEARLRATLAQASCQARLSEIDGFVSVSLAGSGEDYRLILVVRDLRSKLAARERLGGDVHQGHRLLWSVYDPATARPAPAPSRPATPPAVARRSYVPPAPILTVPVETRRVFWAGPVTLTPGRSAGYGRHANCAPSRHGFLASGPRSAPSCPGRGAGFAESIR